MNPTQYRRAEAKLIKLKKQDTKLEEKIIGALRAIRVAQNQLEFLRRERVANMKERSTLKEKLILSDSPCEISKE